MADPPRRTLAASLGWANLLGLSGKAKARARPSPRPPPAPSYLRFASALGLTKSPRRPPPPLSPPERRVSAASLGLDMKGTLGPAEVRGVHAERKRLAAIFASPAAKSNFALVRHLALETDLPAASVVQMLADMAAAAPKDRWAGRHNPYAYTPASLARAQADADSPRNFAKAMQAAAEIVRPVPPTSKETTR